MAFAKSSAKVDLTSGRLQSISILPHIVADYGTNWLAQTRELPTGFHKANTVRRHPMIYANDLPVLTVDFSPLRRLSGGVLLGSSHTRRSGLLGGRPYQSRAVVKEG